jgi:hypothetical protein
MVGSRASIAARHYANVEAWGCSGSVSVLYIKCVDICPAIFVSELRHVENTVVGRKCQACRS